jgi:hypothetical protein
MTTFFGSALSTLWVPIKRDRTIVPALVAQENVDALLGRVEDARSRPGQPHAFFECCERLLEREVARLKTLDDSTQLRQHLIESGFSAWLFGLHHQLPFWI